MGQSIEQAFLVFVSLLQAMQDREYADHPSNPEITFTSGKKYWRVVKVDAGSRYAFCFVEKATGNILKTASWSKPARGIRGNILNQDQGMAAVTTHGAVYWG